MITFGHFLCRRRKKTKTSMKIIIIFISRHRGMEYYINIVPKIFYSSHVTPHTNSAFCLIFKLMFGHQFFHIFHSSNVKIDLIRYKLLIKNSFLIIKKLDIEWSRGDEQMRGYKPFKIAWGSSLVYHVYM